MLKEGDRSVLCVRSGNGKIGMDIGGVSFRAVLCLRLIGFWCTREY